MANITREVMRALRKDIEEALGTVANKHGLTLELGNGRFNASEGHFKLNITAPTAKGAIDRLQAAYDLKAPLLDLVPRGSSVMVGGKLYTVYGFNTKAQLYPIVIQDSTGKRFKVRLNVAKTAAAKIKDMI